jgi:hypothetical protein
LEAQDAASDIAVLDASSDALTDSFDAPSDSITDATTDDGTPPDAGFTPTELTGLVLWLRADIGLQLSSNNVTTWLDQSPNSFDLDAQDGPNTYLPAGGPNAQPAISFSSGSLYRAAPLIAGADAARTMCVVLQPTTQTGEMAVLQDGPVTSNGIGYYLNGGSAWTRSILLTNVSFEMDTVSSTGTPWECACVINTGNSQQRLRVAGADHVLSVSTLAPSAATSQFSLGGSHGVAAYNFHGVVAEVIVFNRVLLNGEQLALEGYLNMRYGL